MPAVAKAQVRRTRRLRETAALTLSRRLVVGGAGSVKLRRPASSSSRASWAGVKYPFFKTLVQNVVDAARKVQFFRPNAFHVIEPSTYNFRSDAVK
jgi:hypothetical protein